MSEGAGFSYKVTGNGLALGHLKAAGSGDDAGALTGTTPDPAVASGGDIVLDEVTLSGEAAAFVAPTATGPGKSHLSTAHRALAAIKEFSALGGLPFGQIVSTLARTGSLASLLPPPPEPKGPTDTSSSLPGDTTDPATDETGPVSTQIGEPLSPPQIPVLEVAPEDGALIELLESIANSEEEDDTRIAIDFPDQDEDAEETPGTL